MTSKSFGATFASSANQLGLSVVVLLAWISLCDGDVSERELEALKGIAAAGEHELDTEAIIQVAAKADVADLQLCCEVVRHLPPAARETFLQVAISTAIADGVLRPSENHILLFLVDVLAVGPKRFGEIFAEITGRVFPQPTNLSDPQTWGEWQDRRQQRESSSEEDARSSRARYAPTSASHIRALATLGLEEGATDEQIRDAYRRLAKVHHPDRFSSLGPEAERAATSTFQRIKTAYDLLSAR
jgi:uncharacterized tellurite resistance protein B-like protein